ncbi:MAG: hypothetical protein LBD37_03500 [Treponema sp.]|jgi:hypothetical protein|nr:hypothetical protein [Treponema sp.]
MAFALVSVENWNEWFKDKTSAVAEFTKLSNRITAWPESWTVQGTPPALYMPAGCCVRLNDGWYVNQNQEPVTGAAPADAQTRYIYLSATYLTVSLSAAKPAWNQIKRGYYNGNDRALAKLQAVVQKEGEGETETITGIAYFLFWLYRDGADDSAAVIDKKL